MLFFYIKVNILKFKNKNCIKKWILQNYNFSYMGTNTKNIPNENSMNKFDNK